MHKYRQKISLKPILFAFTLQHQQRHPTKLYHFEVKRKNGDVFLFSFINSSLFQCASSNFALKLFVFLRFVFYFLLLIYTKLHYLRWLPFDDDQVVSFIFRFSLWLILSAHLFAGHHANCAMHWQSFKNCLHQFWRWPRFSRAENSFLLGFIEFFRECAPFTKRTDLSIFHFIPLCWNGWAPFLIKT